MTTNFDASTLERYREGLRAREARRHALLAKRLHALREAASAAAKVLKRDFGATRVVLFGSTAHGQGVHERSDIDLAVTGVSTRDFWMAAAAAERAAGFELDLVDLSFAKPSLREHVEQTGIEL